jgi:hypothetical protein
MGMVIGFARDVHVVEVRRILKTKKKAHVAMTIFFAGLKQSGIQDKIAEHLVGN